MAAIHFIQAAACLFCIALMLSGAPVRAQVCGAAGGDNRPGVGHCAMSTDVDRASPAGDAPVSATRASIDLVTGNKYLRDTDARWPDGLVLIRHYNSRNGFAHTLGAGWSHSWDTTVVPRGGAELQVIQGDGRRRTFRRSGLDQEGAHFRSADPLAGYLLHRTSADTTAPWLWRLPDGRVMHFDLNGRLSALHEVGGSSLTLAREPGSGRLLTVTTGHGVALRLSYDDQGRLSVLRHPDGGATRYHYDVYGLLVRVQAVDGTALRYDYGADSVPHGVTRITDDRGAAVGVFEYDAQGRAIASRMAGQAGLRVAYRLPVVAGGEGETTVSHEHEGVSRYRWRYQRHAHRALMLSAVGAGCAICPPVGVTRRYDAAGRVVHESWDQNGHSVSWQRDAAGRVVRALERGPDGPGHAFATRTRRYEYLNSRLDSPLSAVIDASVAPGRERVVRWAHDAQGRVVAQIRSGFTPDLRSLNADQSPSRWLPIERRTSFAYQTQGPARGRLAWVDGPLPGEADRTHFRYDDAGRLVSIDRPGGISETQAFDRYGRLIESTDIDGVRTQFTLNSDGSPLRIDRAGMVSQAHRTREGDLLITRQGRAVLGFHRAGTGQIQAISDASGVRQALPTAAQARFVNAPEVAVPKPSTAAFKPSTAALAVSQPGGGRTVYTDPLGARTTEWRNDFGELVATDSPQGGLTLEHQDAGGRVVARVHESGAIEQLAYDAAGRLSSRGDRANPQAVRYTWRGSRLQSVSDQVQTLEYAYDAQGRVLEQAVTMGGQHAARAGRSAPMVTRWRRDPSGQVVAQTLPGGHGLGIARDGWGRPVAIALHSADGQRVLLADQLMYPQGGTLAAPLAGYRAGNGVRVAFGHDALQRLTDISASRVLGILSGRAETSAAVFHQRIVYDARGKITAIVRDGETMAYRYDPQGRLIGAADQLGAEGFAYDDNGNRRVHLRQPASPGAAAQIDHYAYARDGRLLHIASPADPGRSRWLGRSASGALGIELSETAVTPGRVGVGQSATWRDARLRGVLRGAHGRAVAAFADDRLLAVYDYDARGLRVRRVTGESDAQTELYLYQDGLVVGVADGRGRLRRWMVRLGPWPLAELRFEEGRLSAVHWLLADQRGAPLKALDARGKLVWQARYSAFGETLPDPQHAGRVASAPGTADPGLRLAGQWFDPETGRHENGWRSYVPQHGRYAQPDPLGPRAGPNERAYVGGDPIGRVDPVGLYEIDVHYYLTYFLARVAGVTPQRSHTLALAAQYVDDNPDTRPETVANFEARALYHFVMEGHDRTSDPSVRYRDPRSPQLNNLLAAARSELATECARIVFLGEYLHTFEDTFSHRDQANVPFSPNAGHLRSGHDPDQTYDVVNSAAPAGSLLRQFSDYTWNDERSMRMAQETYATLQRYFGSQPIASFSQLEAVVRRFNLTGADQYAQWVSRSMRPETNSEYAARKTRELRDKVAVLSEAMRTLGLGGFEATYADAGGDTYQAAYRSEEGASNRSTFLAGLSHGTNPATDPFRGILLPGD